MRANKLILISALLLIIPIAAGIPFAVLPDVGVNGTVTNVSLEPIEGALVDILSPLELNDITDENGNYFIRDVPEGSYDIVASKQGFNSLNKQFYIKDNVVTIDFVLYTAGSECKPDCSKTSDEKPRCNADCDGINGCNFYDEITKEACTTPLNRVVGVTESYNETHKLTCCEGAPYKHTKLSGKNIILPESDNIVRITRIVFYKGQFARMIIDMFE
ncbi:MAG: carboxypeptidase-like regulatory domain-containing protein [Nanoarchaeota archaeon]|nr:carboxypeptidase-like regulatory domain-containing protein [Nanoarchaeota archaeon]